MKYVKCNFKMKIELANAVFFKPSLALLSNDINLIFPLKLNYIQSVCVCVCECVCVH